MTEVDVLAIVRAALKKSGHDWRIKGVVDADRQLYTLSDDTKLISKVFELVAFPVIMTALEPMGVKVESEARQTVYPDLTVILNQNPPNKIAIDIKSTYRKNLDTGGFTLGSYTAYMRPPGTKNISYPYSHYLSHLIVGFIYSRVPGVKPRVLPLAQISSVEPPIKDVELIIQEKWRIASDIPGSGNTANMGSVRRLEALRNGEGTFTQFGDNGKAVFEDYWANYDRNHPRNYSNIATYLEWRKKNPLNPPRG